MKVIAQQIFLLVAIASQTGLNAKKLWKFKNNAFTDVVVAIHPDVPENEQIINSIKSMMTDASAVMFTATKKRAYFKEVTILVPNSWKKGSYLPAAKENFDDADIRIAPPNPRNGDNPYCTGITKCGNTGKFIHLTPNYLLDPKMISLFAPRGKLLLHEWGHCRWGVFDEYPYEGEDPSFYLDSNGKFQATRCSLGIRGKYLDQSQKDCKIDGKTLLPVSGCVFTPFYSGQPNNVQTSMMFMQHIDEVTTFCQDDPQDPINNHNKDAPNRQNRYCDGRSTWDVIMSTPDFRNGNNKPNPSISNTVPSFKVLQKQRKRIVLVMDTSGSMVDDGKLGDLRRSARQFLLSGVGDGTSVGLVTFSSQASVSKQLTEVNQGDGSRESLVSLLPNFAHGGTAIGKGILAGIEVLSNNGQDPEGGHIIVLTDGEETDRPFVEDVKPEVLSKGVIMNSIFFGLVDPDSDASLAQTSQSSGGDWYYASDAVNSGSELNNIFAALARTEDGGISTESVQIASSSFEILADVTISSTIAIDGSVGLRTQFSFGWLYSEPTIEVKSPLSSCIFSNKVFEGKTYCPDNNIHETDTSFMTTTFTIPETAEFGTWEYSITGTFTDVITVSVTSAPSSTIIYPITVEPEITLTNVSGNQAAIVAAKVSQNLRPVLGAMVTATVTRPTGKEAFIILLDNGAGSDLDKMDGFYSRYFSDFNAPGRYFVKVDVYKDGNDPVGTVGYTDGAKINEGYISEDGIFVPNPDAQNIEPVDLSGAKIDGVLQRTASTGGLAYTGQVSSVDIFPPNKITDVSLSQADLSDASSGVKLTFTAPGDDYDSGTASRYEIRYTFNESLQLRSDFSNQTLVANESIIQGNLSKPEPAMETENFTFTLQAFPENLTAVRVALAVRAFDEENNPSDISNIAFVTFFIEPPPPPPTIPTTTTSGLPFGDHFWYFIGGLIGGIVLLILIVVIACLMCRR